jgi:hypothetical protein
MKNNSFIHVVVILLLFSAFVIARACNQAALKRDGVIVQVRILDAIAGGKSSGGFRCSFVYKGEKLERISPSSVMAGRYRFVGKTFPAMYLHKTRTLNILITPKDFKKFGLPFPDSLNWVLQKL